MTIDFRRFDLELRHTWRIASGVGGPGKQFYPVVFVELRDERGRQGVGEAAPSSRYQENVETVQSFLKGIQASRLSFDDVSQSMSYLDTLGPGNYSAKCAVNLALLDGAARAEGRPVYDHLGLGFREGRHVTSFSIGIDAPDIIRRKVEEAAAFPVLKLKVGSPQDRQNLAALRDAAPAKTVRVDANEAWGTKEEAIRQIEQLATDPRIEFIEQPMPASTARADLEWLKARSPLPLFADESYHHARDVDQVAGCFHGVNVKLVKTGGISGALVALQAARRVGLKTMIGCMIESSVLISAAAHLAELTDHLDIDGTQLIRNDPYAGATAGGGRVSFQTAPAPAGLRVAARRNAHCTDSSDK